MEHEYQLKSRRCIGKYQSTFLNICSSLALLGCTPTGSDTAAPPKAPVAAQKGEAKGNSAKAPPDRSEDEAIIAEPKAAPADAPTDKKKSGAKIPCGSLSCYGFDSAQEALSFALAEHDPRVVSFGEAHAPAGFQAESTVARFRNQLLPVVAPKSSYLMVELLAPPKEGCEKEKKEAQKESDKITEGQSGQNQNEYVALGMAARELKVVPDILRASCEDMATIASPEGGVLAYMDTIKKLFERDLAACLGRTQKDRPVVLSYGGALHNDAMPRPGRESWSFGPAMKKLTDGRYLEVDLIVPELIADTDSWKSFAWYDAYQSIDNKDQALVVSFGPDSVALIFPPQGNPPAETKK